MRTLYLDCSMGAAGDMLAGALLELVPDRDVFLRTLNSLGLPGVQITAVPAEKCGIRGTHFSVTVHGETERSHDHHDHEHDHHGHDHGGHVSHSHSSLADITHLVQHMPLSDKVRQDVLNVYQLIAEGESAVHGLPVSQIHFHEVGTLDALADITAVCLLMDSLSPQQVIASPVHVGSGHVICAHGILPVPAPATAYILKGIPIYGGAIQGELCTPTGAALLKYFVTEFGNLPVMKTSTLGYGMGTKDFPMANCLRAMLADTWERDAVMELTCNLDDMTGEELGFVSELLFNAGALDVCTIPIGMKKGRPGIQLCVLCPLSERERFVKLIFQHTTTLGIREAQRSRCTLSRREEIRNGVRVKIAEGYGVYREKPEYEDLADLARKEGISLQQARGRLSK